MNLKINDKTYELEWGMGAIEIYCDLMDCDISDIDLHLASPKLIHQIKAINTLTLAAIQNGCESAKPKIDFDIDYKDLQKWLDKQPQEVGTAIIEDWKKSYYFGKTVAEYFFGEVEEDVTKPVVNKKKRPSAKS
jgi:hypothetical protein